MGMPLDLYVIRHGESEANVIISAGEQGDNSLYTQDNVTVNQIIHRHAAQLFSVTVWGLIDGLSWTLSPALAIS